MLALAKMIVPRRSQSPYTRKKYSWISNSVNLCLQCNGCTWRLPGGNFCLQWVVISYLIKGSGCGIIMSMHNISTCKNDIVQRRSLSFTHKKRVVDKQFSVEYVDSNIPDDEGGDVTQI